VTGIRIGELARRTGLSPDVLRVWERRFALFSPERTPGGYRLYTPEDERLAHEVIALKTRGLPLALAVEQAQASLERARAEVADQGRDEIVAAAVEEIDAAVREMDQVAAGVAVTRAIATLGVEASMVEVLLPYLVRLGRQWEQGEVTVAHEHFASHLVRRHVGAHGVEHGPAGRRTAVLACPPGERHDIGTLMTAVALSRRGWSVSFLGADTPLSSVDTVASAQRPDVIVLGGTRPSVFEAVVPLLARLGSIAQLAIGGAGAGDDIAERIGAVLLPLDPVSAAAVLDEIVSSASATA
jgi:DNA-binding transcriptional MerR regulator